VDKAEKTPPGTLLEGQSVSVSGFSKSWMCAIHGACRFAAQHHCLRLCRRKDAKTHGLAEDASKKLQGTLWVDEADRQWRSGSQFHRQL